VNIAYGINISETDDTYTEDAEEAFKGLAEAAIPGKFLVDLLPILKYVPSWMPGASFKRKAAYWRRVNADMAQKPFAYVKETFVSSIALCQFLSVVEIRIYTAARECGAIRGCNND
jgi:hypothetical protein